MKIFITGGTGFIGSALVQKILEQNHEVVIATRSAPAPELHAKSELNKTYVTWNAKDQGPWASELDGSDAVINLAGQGIFDQRWSKEVKQKLIDSRLDATGAIVEAIKNAKHRPRVLISASAVGFYGDTKDVLVDEKNAPGSDFLADICMEWEEAARVAAGFNVRVTHPRIGIVLGKNGGALKQLLPPFKAFAGGPVGSGEQWFPWVHIEDVVNSILLPLTNENLEGPYNVASPDSVRMKEFCKILGQTLNRPSWVSVPGSVLKVIVGEAADAILSGQHISPHKLLSHGFKFKYLKLGDALKSLLS
jgi:uncharacterized protein (TIGR01777 family)